MMPDEGAANTVGAVGFNPQDNHLVGVARKHLTFPGVTARPIDGRGDSRAEIEVALVPGNCSISMVTLDEDIAEGLICLVERTL